MPLAHGHHAARPGALEHTVQIAVQLSQRPTLKAFHLSTPGLFIQQQQVEVTAKTSRTTAITAEPLARREAPIPEVEATEERQNVVVARASA